MARTAHLGIAVVLGGVAVGLVGCTAAVPVAAAPAASDPLCAQVVLATPTSLGAGLDQVPTTAQATRAWGTARSAVVLRCGVEPPGPTTDRCVAYEGADGVRVDWLVVPSSDGTPVPTTDGPAPVGGDADWTFTTYGREPAVEVFVPAAVAARHSTSFLDQLAPAVQLVPQGRHCL